jgi:hypothetical protein
METAWPDPDIDADLESPVDAVGLAVQLAGPSIPVYFVPESLEVRRLKSLDSFTRVLMLGQTK